MWCHTAVATWPVISAYEPDFNFSMNGRLFQVLSAPFYSSAARTCVTEVTEHVYVGACTFLPAFVCSWMCLLD